ncbi:MAG: SRPBCC family protein [Gemmatimonadota bacterium]|nr:MAG: SRPBCC family protein [Gemmatimonadota bacterium]
MNATPARCFQVAADVERWPELLSHYRWVRFRRRDGFGRGLVEMAARRMFGPLGYPVWWMSEMWADESIPVVRYKHVEGITAGMDVEWRFSPEGDATTRVEIVHEWPGGPRWPLLGRPAARWVIGPAFIHHVAGMTLEGVRRAVEAQ